MATSADEVANKCTLLGGTFAMLVQLGLAVSAIATLVYKRAVERPRRPWLVWFFDASKQAFAGVLQHGVNLMFGVIFAQKSGASECAWYLVNFCISVACGVLILWVVMRAYTYLVDRYHITLLRSGEYGTPPSWRPWLAQMLIWGFFASGEKVLTAVVVILPLHSQLDGFAAVIEQPLLHYPMSELVLVMVVAPVILNMAFFWVIDNIIMRRRARHLDPHTPEGRCGDDDDRPQDDKQPLLEDLGGTNGPPFTPTQSPQVRAASSLQRELAVVPN